MTEITREILNKQYTDFNTYSFENSLRKKGFSDEVVIFVINAVVKYKPYNPWSYLHKVARGCKSEIECREALNLHAKNRKEETVGATKFFGDMQAFLESRAS